jgi:hypothetical protein
VDSEHTDFLQRILADRVIIPDCGVLQRFEVFIIEFPGLGQPPDRCCSGRVLPPKPCLDVLIKILNSPCLIVILVCLFEKVLDKIVSFIGRDFKSSGVDMLQDRRDFSGRKPDLRRIISVLQETTVVIR